MAHAIFTASRPKRGGRIAFLRAFVQRLVSWCSAFITAWQRRRRDQQLLRHLDERSLRDLGIERPPLAQDDAIPPWRLDRFTP